MPDGQTLNPFTSVEQPTLRQVLEAVASDETLPLQRRRNICSSIRTLGKLMRRDPGFSRHIHGSTVISSRVCIRSTAV